MNFSLLGSQAVLIVCNDRDPIPDDQVHSNSVAYLFKEVKKAGINIDENCWITLSWPENDQHFSTEKHKQYLVRVKQLVDPLVSCSASQESSSNAEHKGNIVWEGWLKSGKLITTYQRPGWELPDVVYRTVYEDNKHKSYTEFRVKQTENGGFNIKTDSELLGKAKGFLKGFGF